MEAYTNRIKLTKEDMELGISLWHAYTLNDFNTLLALSQTSTKAFKYLPEVCQAHIDRFPTEKSEGRPERLIRELMIQTPNDFNSVFAAFSKKAGIYGFGDTQVKGIYDRLNLLN